jgi:hypothetical protein
VRQRSIADITFNCSGLTWPAWANVLLEQVGGEAMAQGGGVTRLAISAIWAAAWQARVSWRVVIGLAEFWPGNSQPRGLAALSLISQTNVLRA